MIPLRDRGFWGVPLVRRLVRLGTLQDRMEPGTDDIEGPAVDLLVAHGCKPP